MRILHLVHQYMPDKVGGTELYTETIARYQHARGHETAVFTPANLPPGCSFQSRCPFAFDRCTQERPRLASREPGRMEACHLLDAS